MLSLARTTAAAGQLNLARALSMSAAACAKKGDPTLPTPPKKGPSPYTLFFKDFYAREKDNHLVDSKINVQSIARAAGSAWNALGEADKAGYTDAARRAKAEADRGYRAFYDGLAPETRRALEAQLAKAGKKLGVPGGKKAAREALRAREGNPGRPLSAFFAYAHTVRDEVRRQIEDEGVDPTKVVTEVAKRTGDMWKHVAESEKEDTADRQAFRTKYKEAKEKYDAWLKEQGL